MSKEIRTISVVELTITMDEKHTVGRIMQMAETYGARLLYQKNFEGTTTMGFETNNPKILSIMLKN